MSVSVGWPFHEGKFCVVQLRLRLGLGVAESYPNVEVRRSRSLLAIGIFPWVAGWRNRRRSQNPEARQLR